MVVVVRTSVARASTVGTLAGGRVDEIHVRQVGAHQPEMPSASCPLVQHTVQTGRGEEHGLSPPATKWEDKRR